MFRSLKRKNTLLIVLTVLLLVGVPVFSFGDGESRERKEGRDGGIAESNGTTNRILVVNQGNKADREAVGHFPEWSKGYSVVYETVRVADLADDFSITSYAGAIVMSTGQAQGRDPELVAFLKEYENALPMIFVGLIPGSKSTEYTLTEAATSDLGVDVVTAATRWGGKVLREMHVSWFEDVLTILLGARS